MQKMIEARRVISNLRFSAFAKAVAAAKGSTAEGAEA